MQCALARLLLAVLLAETSLSLSASAGRTPASSCPAGWLPFGPRCLAFYPVWSSWTDAEAVCAQKGGHLASLYTPEEMQFVRQLANTDLTVWLGGRRAQRNGSWFWSDDSEFKIRGWTNQRLGEGGACLTIKTKSGELESAPCGELRFYICSSGARYAHSKSIVAPGNRKSLQPGIVPTQSLFQVLWSSSDSLVEVILRSSTFLEELRSGRLTQSCYDRFVQQEALYLQRVSGMLEVLIGRFPEGDEATWLLRDTFKQYRSGNQSRLPLPPPPWLRSSLASFHAVALEEPVYWLVALSARAGLRHLVAGELLSSGGAEAGGRLLQEWIGDAKADIAWTRRYRKLVEERQNHMEVFQAINIFRDHMINQKSLHKAVACDEEEERSR
ncbi:uncharacterized protein LOC119222976 isoform X1 [Pungitius pungitius]|uniref:uncharacterized protein LOC119222976 isoform X1 n=1 Tax=Pungitius pungitius TaxID=134920 RepID=UPI002E110E4A